MVMQDKISVWLIRQYGLLLAQATLITLWTWKKQKKELEAAEELVME